MDYVTFLIDAGGVVRGSVSKAPDPRQPDELDVFKVICTGRRVTVIGRDQERTTRVFATARWRTGQLDRRTLSKGTPRLTPEQWTMIRDAIAEHVDHIALDGEEPTPLFKAAVWGAIVALPLAVFLVQFTCEGESEPDEPPAAAAAVTPVPEPLDARIMKADSFKDAFALAKPTMTDTFDELGGGAKLFATYAASKLRWEDLDVPPETTFGHVFKDPAVERGKRMCAEGVILDIERRDLGPRKIYVGTLRASTSELIAFVAVGTTGELVRKNTARFCGAVIGKAGSAASMVGMFDLPENRTPIVEQ